jgi:hypothetical protein
MGYIYIRNKGGLGNQLFIYNFGLLISRIYNKKLVVDNTTGFWFDKYGRYPVLSLLVSPLLINANFKQKILFLLFKRAPLSLRNFFKIHFILETSSSDLINIKELEKQKYQYKFIFIDGYFQSNSYLIDDNYSIAARFNYSYNFSNDYTIYNNSIFISESVCVHVRRKQYDNLLTKEYYEKAFMLIKQNVESPVFFVFSDDLKWCREVFKSERVVFVDNIENIDDIQEFHLMVSCNHFIIANSTFSWWAAIFGKYNNKIVIAPTNNQLASKQSFYHKDWIQI